MATAVEVLGNIFQFVDGIVILVVTLALALIVLVACLYMLAYYQHPDDPDQSWFSKFVVVFSLWLVFFTPIFSAIDFASVASDCPPSLSVAQDVENFQNNPNCMAPVGLILYLLITVNLVMTYVFIPLTANVAKDSASKTLKARLGLSLLKAFFRVGSVMGVFVLTFVFFGDISVPTLYFVSGQVQYNSTYLSGLEACLPAPEISGENDPTATLDIASCTTNSSQIYFWTEAPWTTVPSTEKFMTQSTNFALYLLSLHAIVGWFILSLYGGVGLAAFPLRHLKSFVYRAKRPATKSEYIRLVREISESAKNIKEEVEKTRNDTRISEREKRSKAHKLTRAIVLLEQEEQHLADVYPEGDDPDGAWTMIVFKNWFALFYGLTGLLVSIAWVLQIWLFSIQSPPLWLGLNRIFKISADEVFFVTVLQLVLLVFFCFHLTLCCIDGVYTVGLVVPFVAIHPLSLGNTMIDAFLYNTNVILYAAPAILAFQQVTLSLAAAGSNISLLYGYQFRFLEVFNFIQRTQILLYPMMFFFGLTILLQLFDGVKYMLHKRKLARRAFEQANRLAGY